MKAMKMPTNFDRTAAWFDAAKRESTKAGVTTQAGVHIEEFCEMLREMTLVSTTGVTSAAMQEVAVVLSAIADNMKAGHVHLVVHDKAAFLDSLCDQSVTVDGLAHLCGFDKNGADTAVIDANFDKFVDGVAVIKPGGKIGKRDGWQPADLTPFIGTSDALADIL